MFSWFNYLLEMEDDLFSDGGVTEKHYSIRYCKAAENGLTPLFAYDQFTVTITEIDLKQEMAADAAANPELYRVVKRYDTVSYSKRKDDNNNLD